MKFLDNLTTYVKKAMVIAALLAAIAAAIQAFHDKYNEIVEQKKDN